MDNPVKKLFSGNRFREKKNFILSYKDISFILVSLLVIGVFYFFHFIEGLSHDGQIMIGILLMAAILWISEAIPLSVTGLLIMMLQPLLGVMPADDVFSSFGNQAVFFLIGAFIIASAVERHGLHRRIALRFLSFFESSPRLLTLGIMFSCAFMSFIMPEHGVAALFLPIITSILVAMRVVPKKSNFGKVSMLCVAYGCSIGSLGTLVGGARNPLTISFLANLENPITVSFLEWMTYSMPIVFVALPLVWVILQFAFPIKIKDITSAKREIDNQVAKEGSMSRKEFLVLGIMVLTVLLWIFFSHYTYFGLAGIALLGGVLLFLTGCLKWEDVEKRMPWGIILLYGGAITLGIGIKDSGAGEWIAGLILNSLSSNVFLVIVGLILVTILLTNVMSNTGAVAALLPIGVSIAAGLPLVSPLLASLLIALTGGLAFMLVIATPGNAITYSSGYFSTRDLFKAGFLANVLCIAVVFFIAVFYWRGVLGL